jgi:hypothetical protein
MLPLRWWKLFSHGACQVHWEDHMEHSIIMLLLLLLVVVMVVEAGEW